MTELLHERLETLMERTQTEDYFVWRGMKDREHRDVFLFVGYSKNGSPQNAFICYGPESEACKTLNNDFDFHKANNAKEADSLYDNELELLLSVD